MEASIMLLTDFVRNLRILDREFRATQGAMDHVRKHFREQENAARNLALRDGRREVEHQLSEMKSLWEASRKQQEAELDSVLSCRSGELDRIARLRQQIALAENLTEAVLHAQELTDEKITASPNVTLEDLLSGKANLEKDAIAVNELYRAGKKHAAQKAWARLKANADMAKEELAAEIRRLSRELTDDMKKRQDTDADHARKANGTQRDQLYKLMHWMDEHIAEGTNVPDPRTGKNDGEMEYYRNKREERMEQVGSWFRMSFPPMEFAEEIRRSGEQEPAFDRFRCAREVPQTLWLAGTGYDLAGMNLCGDTVDFLRKYYPFLYREGQLSLPSGLDCAAGNLEFHYTAKQRPHAVKQAAGLALRLFALTPPGRMKMTFVDPVTLGESFAGFARLADLDLGDGSVIGGKIATSMSEIERRLTAVADHISDVTQRCLQGKYQNLMEYNQEAWDRPEGYHVLMLMDYPAGLSEQALRLLDRIVRSGPKCGVFTVIYRSEEQIKKLSDKQRLAVSGIREPFRVMCFTDEGRIRHDTSGVLGGSFFWKDRPTASGDQADELIRTLKQGL